MSTTNAVLKKELEEARNSSQSPPPSPNINSSATSSASSSPSLPTSQIKPGAAICHSYTLPSKAKYNLAGAVYEVDIDGLPFEAASLRYVGNIKFKKDSPPPGCGIPLGYSHNDLQSSKFKYNQNGK